MTTFTIDELVQTIREETGEDLSPRTIRYYIAEGVLRRPDARGTFTEAHLDRLKLILRLKQAFLPIPEIRRQLELLTDGDVKAQLERYETQGRSPASNLAAEYTQRLMAQRAGPLGENVPPPSSTPGSGVKAETWERFLLAPGVELHVRKPLSLEEQEFLDSLLEHAQQLRKKGSGY
jgi:DNA-binding transcriptional MerR regulator